MKMGMPSVLEETLALQLRAEKISFEREVTGLVPGRKFRVDFLVEKFLTVECQGGIYRAKGAHNTPAAIARDAEKAAELLLAGYLPLSATKEQITSGMALEWIRRAIDTYKPKM